MIAIPTRVMEDAIALFEGDILQYSENVRNKLNNLQYNPTIASAEKKYLALLLSMAADIITINADEIEKTKVRFDDIIPGAAMASKVHKAFRESLIDIMDYSSLRTNFYPKFFRKIGLKSCVYCNSQLAVTMVSKKRSANGKDMINARFQLDHFWPQAEYPCFSISLYNLYPVCACCNNGKSKQHINFHLYESDTTPAGSNFAFTLKSDAKARYLLTRDPNLLSISFRGPETPKGRKPYQLVFDIEGIYNTQTDLAEEILLKALVYTEKYKKALVADFPKIFRNETVLTRLIVGNYIEERDIHKRPLSKFTMDLARQIGLISKPKDL